MITEHSFERDGLTYYCKRGMTPPPVGWEKKDIPRNAYWDVTRSDGAAKKIWVPVGQEFTPTELEAATLQEFGS